MKFSDWEAQLLFELYRLANLFKRKAKLFLSFFIARVSVRIAGAAARD